MAATNKQLIAGVTTSGTTAEIKYTAPAGIVGTRVTAFSAHNTSGSVATYTVYIKEDATAAGAVNTIVERALQPGESDTPLEILNQIIPAGGTIQVKTDVAGNTAFTASGVEFT